MKRRHVLGLMGLAGGALVAGPLWAAAPVDYTPEIFAKAEAEGRVIFLDFSATWCPTCRAQGRAIEALRQANPAYDAKILFLRVDWDAWGDGELSQRLAIPRRSTLVVLKGGAEIGRIVADTDSAAIQALMDQALAAA